MNQLRAAITIAIAIAISFNSAANADLVTFLNTPTQQTSSLSLTSAGGNIDVTITAQNGTSASLVSVLLSNGLGVGAASTERLVTPGEALRFIFDSPVQNVSYTINATSSSNSTPNKRFLTVFAPDSLMILGQFNQSDVDLDTDVSSLVGNVDIGGFELRNTAFGDSGNGFGLEGLNVSAVPEPSSFLMVGIVGAAFAALRRRKRVSLAENCR